MANTNLTNAMRSKNDEFYTQYGDIEKEITAYLEFNPDIFRDKTILLPCDDPEWSNFTKFFAQNFETLAEAATTSNCPLCALGHDANKNKVLTISEMDADHVSAWSKGGTTDIKNCQMLCTTHNKAKGNR